MSGADLAWLGVRVAIGLAVLIPWCIGAGVLTLLIYDRCRRG